MQLKSWNALLFFLVCSLNLNAQSLVLTSASGTDNQTVCENSAITNIEYTIGDGATGASITASNLPAGVTGTLNAGVFTISGTPTGISTTYTYTVTTSGGVNSPVSLSGIINTTTVPSATAGGFITTCTNESPTVVGAAASNGTIFWTHDGSGTLSNGTTTSPVYTPTVYDAGNTVTLTMTVTNSCGTATAQYTINVNPLPTATAGGTITICPNEVAIPSGVSASNGNIMWTENGLGSITSGANTPTPSYTSANGDAGTTVTLTLTVSDLGCTNPITATATYTINIQDNLGPNMGALNACVGTSTVLTNQTTGGTWTSSNPSIATVDASGWVTGISQGSCDIFYTATSNGCSQTVSATITINETPIISGTTTTCVGSTLQLTGSGTQNSGIPWSSNTSGVATVSSTGTVTGVSAGTTLISYMGINGCTSTIPVTINALPTITLTGNTTVCEGGDLLVTPSTIPTMASFNWTGPNSYTASSSNLSITNIQSSMAGTYICTASSNGCENTESATIVVNAPLTPTLIFEDTVCRGSIFILPTTSSNTPPISGTILPGFFDSNTIGTATYTFTPTAGECASSVPMNITVIQCPGITAGITPTSVSADGICDGTATINITSGSAPFNYLFSDNQTQTPASGLCEGIQSVTISDANGDTLTLNFLVPSPSNTTTTANYLDSVLVDTLYNPAVTNCIVDYLQIDSAQIASYTILPNDSVSVTWSVYSAGTLTTITDIYVVGSTSGIYMIALQIYCPQKTLGQFLVAYDQLYYNSALLSITDKYDDHISIAPNPFDDYVQITFENDQKTVISISDISGKKVYSNTFNSKLVNLDLHTLSSGHYIVTIDNGSTKYMKHIVK